MEDTGMTSSRVPAAVAADIDCDSDVSLVDRHLSGDAHAFEILFKRYQSPIFGLVSRMVAGEDAYDLTQDVFCNALRALHTFRGDSKFSTWLYSIARNVCLNRIRHNACTREDSLEAMYEDQPYSEIADASVDVEVAVETHEMQRLVNKVLAAMPDEQRILIALRDFEQLSYEEIAAILGLSVANVKSRLHRARLVFREKFRPYIALLGEG